MFYHVNTYFIDDEDANIVYADGASNFIGANQQAGIGVYWGPDDERYCSCTTIGENVLIK